MGLIVHNCPCLGEWMPAGTVIPEYSILEENLELEIISFSEYYLNLVSILFIFYFHL